MGVIFHGLPLPRQETVGVRPTEEATSDIEDCPLLNADLWREPLV